MSKIGRVAQRIDPTNGYLYSEFDTSIFSLTVIPILGWFKLLPWTLPSNTALTVGPKINYVLVTTFNQYTFERINVILAEKLVEYQFSGKFKKLDTISDLDLYQCGDKKIPYYIGTHTHALSPTKEL